MLTSILLTAMIWKVMLKLKVIYKFIDYLMQSKSDYFHKSVAGLCSDGT